MGGLCEEDAVDDGDLGHRRAVARGHPAARRLLEQGRDPARRLHEGHYVFLVIAVLTAALTAFYMARATFLAFFVEARAALQERARARVAVGHGRPARRARRARGGRRARRLAARPATRSATFLGEHAEGEMNLVLAAIAVGAALAASRYAWAMYIKGWIKPDWYMENRFVEIVLARHFRIDEAYDLVLVSPVLATSRVLPPRRRGRRRRRRARVRVGRLRGEPRCSRSSTARASTARSTGSATASWARAARSGACSPATCRPTCCCSSPRSSSSWRCSHDERAAGALHHRPGAGRRRAAHRAVRLATRKAPRVIALAAGTVCLVGRALGLR